MSRHYFHIFLSLVSFALISCLPITSEPSAKEISIEVSECVKCKGKDPNDIFVVAVVEPRKHQALIPIVKNAINILPSNWIIQIFHGLTNKEFVKAGLSDEIASGKVVLSQINVDNLTLQGYNRDILLNPYFWKQALGENILLMETDSTFCSGSKFKIDDFIQYDYVGGPFGPDLDYSCHIYEGAQSNEKYVTFRTDATVEELQAKGFSNVRTYRPNVGNSGFSFRKRSKTIELLRRYVPKSALLLNRSSDIFMSCVALDPDANVNLAPGDVAKNFSIAVVYSDAPLAIHKPWQNLTKTELSSLANHCPELDAILRPIYEPLDGWGKSL